MLVTLTPNLFCANRRSTIALVACASLLPIGSASTAVEGVVLPALASSVLSTTPPLGTASIASEFQERLLLVDINRQQLEQSAMVLESRTGQLFLWSQDIQRWHLKQPEKSQGVEYQGQVYFSLSSISQLSHVYNHQDLTLKIELPAAAFERSRLTTRYESLPPPTKPNPGGFINYDLLASQSPESNKTAGLFELGYFNRYGVGTSTMLWDQAPGRDPLTRLTSTWTVDDPETLRSLRLGDAVNVAASWGRAVQFAGIQYGSNFATNPGFVTMPVQSASGQAILPSTVDVFINNALVTQQAVLPGPFSISNLPVVSGAGEVRLVVRDLLGREQIINRPFYASQSLLRSGLKSFSVELGFVRENFGIRSNDYGPWLASGTYRRGLIEGFTGEVHAEAMAEQLTAGAGADFLVPQIGLLSAYWVGSRNQLGKGTMAMLAIERQAQPWSLGARTQWASSGFSQVGDLSVSTPILSSSVNLSFGAGQAGSVGLAYLQQRHRDSADARFTTLSYSVSLGRTASVTLTALRDMGREGGTTLFAMLSLPLQGTTNLSASSQHVRNAGVGNSNDLSTTLQRNLPLGEGIGYRLHASGGGTQEAALLVQRNAGTYSVEVSQNQGITASRVGISGGVALMGNAVFPTRRIEQSFGVVHVADYPNVRVLADNQPVGRTDAQGNALLSRLRPYDINVISIDQRDLPMDAKINAVKMEVTPYYRSAIDINFPIARSFGALLTLIQEDGSPLPVGVAVNLLGNETNFITGYAGEIYLTGLQPKNTLRANWGDHSCLVEVDYAASNDPLPDLGRHVCTRMHP